MKYLILVLFSVIVGCVPVTPPVQRIQFPLSEYKILETEGTGIVKGQAFLKTRGGDVKTAAGNLVFLNPVTSYSDQWYEMNYLLHKSLTVKDSRYDQYIVHKTIADADGKFEFTNVAPGAYYLVASVFWEAPTGYQGSLRRQGGYIAKKIKVENGKELKIILTR